MFVVYVVALGIGGTLLAASLLLGGGHHDLDTDMDVDVDADVDLDADADVDVDADADADVDHDVDAHGVGAMDAVMGWLPFLSLRFWMFFLAFFGLTGSTFELLALHSNPVVTGLVSGGVGYASGMLVVTAMRRLRRRQANSNVGVDDYIGATGIVMVAIEKGKTGKVRLDMKGRSVELMAETEEEDRFEIDQSVLVYGVTEAGRLLVVRPEQLEA